MVWESVWSQRERDGGGGTVRAEIGMSGSSVLEISKYDCWTSVWCDSSGPRVRLIDSEADTKPQC